MAVTISSTPDVPTLADPASFNADAVAGLAWLASTLEADIAAITANDLISLWSGHMVPDTDAAYDLGSASFKFRNLYLSSLAENLPSTVTRLTSGSSATFNLQSDTKRFRIRMVGGGGGGGGANSSTGDYASCGSGGGSGAFEEFIVDAATLGISSFVYTIGSGGTGSNGADGGDGGNTSYTDGTNTITAGGGRGGIYLSESIAAWAVDSGAGGNAGASASSGVQILVRKSGGHGGYGFIMPSGATSSGKISFGGGGADSEFGVGGSYSQIVGSNNSTSGNDAGTGEYGAGGGGASGTDISTSVAGGDGESGLIIVEEYPY